MSERLVKLEAWAEARYGDDKPAVGTLRRWVREARIIPVPKKHGRSYFVSENARYIDPSDPSYARAYRESSATQ